MSYMGTGSFGSYDSTAQSSGAPAAMATQPAHANAAHEQPPTTAESSLGGTYTDKTQDDTRTRATSSVTDVAGVATPRQRE